MLAVAVGVLVAGCGGSGDGSMSKAEIAAKVNAACRKLNGYSVWLPEHLRKTGMSSKEGEALVQRAAEDFRSTLGSLDPPADLQEPLDDLQMPAESLADLRRYESLYEQVGAERCARELQASSFVLEGQGVENAYDRVGLTLPPHPEGW